MKFQIHYLLAIVASVVLLFQNCAPHTFTTMSLEQASTGAQSADGSTCDPSLQPFPQDLLSCPAGSSGLGGTRTRTVVCASSTWSVSAWSNPDYSSCSCSIKGQTVNSISGLCQCPTGQGVLNGQCATTACDAGSSPSNIEIGNCPSGTGSTKRTRTVTCNPSNNLWSTSTWSSWDYSQCSCSAVGQIPNSSTGVCECPSGKTLVNGVCQTPTCSPTAKPSTTESLSCPSGSGTATRSRVVSCPTGSTQWTTGNWISDFSKCTCPAAGQILDSSTGTCSCSSGQVVISGKCQSATCDPALKPTEKESLSCPSGIGSAYRTRVVSCPTGSTQWSAGAWTANYSQCGCPISGQTLNTITGQCACPTGQTVINNACRIADCDPSTLQSTSQSGLTCPNQSVGNYSQTRTATCNKTTLQYEYTPWVPNYSTCGCSITGQTFNSSTKTCQCPSGQYVNGTRCEQAPSCPMPAPSSTEYQACPSGIGTASRPRTVTCAPGATSWTIINGTWNYSSCSCPVIGAVVNASNGSCSCTGGTYEIAGRCGVCASNETYNATTKTCSKITCAHPDTGARVNVGSVYTAYTISIGASQSACDSARFTLTCTSNGQWSSGVPSPHYSTCAAQIRSTGQHCDIGGSWGWRSNETVCPAGTLPISADLVGGCLDGATPNNSNGKIGCYYSNKDPRRPAECAGSDPADECCFWQCSPAGEASVWTCRDNYSPARDGGDSTYQNTLCTDQWGHYKTEYNPPPPPPPPPPCNWWEGCFSGA